MPCVGLLYVSVALTSHTHLLYGVMHQFWKPLFVHVLFVLFYERKKLNVLRMAADGEFPKFKI